jgi:hypothetical protein
LQVGLAKLVILRIIPTFEVARFLLLIRKLLAR